MRDWNALKEEMEKQGWTCDRDDDEKIGFVKLQDEEHEWMRDYDKRTGRLVQLNGRQKINLRSSITTKEATPDDRMD